MKLITCYLLSVLTATLWVQTPTPAQENSDTLAPLVEVLGQTDDPQFQLDILKGMSEALKGRRQVPMPKGWEQVETKLNQSKNADVRTVAQS